MTVFLPLIEQPADVLVPAILRIGPVLVRYNPDLSNGEPLPSRTYLFVESTTSISLPDLVSGLDAGLEKVVVPFKIAKELINLVPAERIVLLLDATNFNAVSDTVRSAVSGVVLKTPTVDVDFITSVARFFSCAIYVLPDSTTPPSLSSIRQLSSVGASLVIPSSQLTLGPSTSSQINVADAFTAVLTSDRKDGLFPTVVCTETGHSLGLVYSSSESVRESIVTGKGVYQSRKHGLWRKGETSGATQDVVSIRLDCDSDSLEFKVVQSGVGFCHLARQSCFGEASGLNALESTLLSRFESAPEQSYTRRLFHDAQLLRSKIMEEADELCRAETPEDVAFEAADLLYFALTKCISAGVGIADIERSLDRKAKKVVRRAGNAKPQWISESPASSSSSQAQQPEVPVQPQPQAQVHPPPPPPIKPDDAPIQMRTYDLSAISMKPIVDDVRTRGDAALLELTAKFDKAKLNETVIFPPFAPESMQIDDSVREAIDVAYQNIFKFHDAQADRSTLTIETTPGVVCSRFARPIARVGLYVPGGTAILPSTALMLGIPAQVAGCKQIVFATPPRPDGSISPEVMYVAHLVGASAILKAGGAQAVAALAYGTATVPKVDKIFGPGNQWVTAAKMLVQNDTDALVSIDMPAGPSEVLVIADHTAQPAFVAADLLSQAEHGVDSQVVLVAVNLSQEKLDDIESEVDKQARALPRSDIVRQSIPKSIIVKVITAEQALEFSNDYAPEHLILHLENARDHLPAIDNAGSVFIGSYTPESCGDYASGTNHTLPTNGYARQFSGVNTQSFQKHITSQEITPAGLQQLGPYVATLADCEGLDAHANAVRLRLRSLAPDNP
ncbi:hypothetical protein ONZ45_g3682 [Pleurotus djamor]|nr:hypothetical protein ONZ45_g3682 [Pleurotus djamor]